MFVRLVTWAGGGRRERREGFSELAVRRFASRLLLRLEFSLGIGSDCTIN